MAEDVGRFLDGRPFLIGSPFSSKIFCFASLLGLGTIGYLAYIVYYSWNLPGINTAEILIVPVGLQLVYQWWRIQRYYSRLRELYSMKVEREEEDGSPIDLALRIATGGLTDLLFYSFGISLTTLIIIGVLLKHITR